MEPNNKKKPVKLLSVQIDTEFHKEIHSRAIQQGKTLKCFVNELLKDGIKMFEITIKRKNSQKKE